MEHTEVRRLSIYQECAAHQGFLFRRAPSTWATMSTAIFTFFLIMKGVHGCCSHPHALQRPWCT